MFLLFLMDSNVFALVHFRVTLLAVVFLLARQWKCDWLWKRFTEMRTLLGSTSEFDKKFSEKDFKNVSIVGFFVDCVARGFEVRALVLSWCLHLLCNRQFLYLVSTWIMSEPTIFLNIYLITKKSHKHVPSLWQWERFSYLGLGLAWMTVHAIFAFFSTQRNLGSDG